MTTWYRKRPYRIAIGLVIGSLIAAGGYGFTGSWLDAVILLMTVSGSVAMSLHPQMAEYDVIAKNYDNDNRLIPIHLLVLAPMVFTMIGLNSGTVHYSLVAPVAMVAMMAGMFITVIVQSSEEPSDTSNVKAQSEPAELNTAD